jgi:hypothetical protein
LQLYSQAITIESGKTPDAPLLIGLDIGTTSIEAIAFDMIEQVQLSGII